MSLRLPAAERREQLLGVALEVFSRHGYDASSMTDVAEAAGVTKPVLYQHFASKRDLYLELLDDVGERLVGAIRDAAVITDTPRMRVERGFHAYFEFVSRERDAFLLLFGGSARIDADFAQRVHRVEAVIADVVTDLIDADVDPAHRRLLGASIVGLTEGASRHLLLTSDAPDPARLARQVADLAWAGLRGVHRV
jgi:AcrR family transcriptional regulator